MDIASIIPQACALLKKDFTVFPLLTGLQPVEPVFEVGPGNAQWALHACVHAIRRELELRQDVADEARAQLEDLLLRMGFSPCAVGVDDAPLIPRLTDEAAAEIADRMSWLPRGPGDMVMYGGRALCTEAFEEARRLQGYSPEVSETGGSR